MKRSKVLPSHESLKAVKTAAIDAIEPGPA
jgi:hypothetical protein